MWLFLNYFILLTMLLDSEHFLFYVCICICESHVHECERPEGNSLWCFRHCPPCFISCSFSRQGLSISWSSPTRLDQLDTKPLESTCLCHPNTEITRPATSSSFFKNMVSRCWTQVPMLTWQVLYQLSITGPQHNWRHFRSIILTLEPCI